MRPTKVLAVRELDIAAMQHANQIDHDVLTLHQFSQRLFAMNIGFRHLDIRLHDECLGALAPTGRNRQFNATL